MHVALHTQWDHMHSATSNDECDPLGTVLKVGHRCWQEGRHVCSGDGIVLQLVAHRWEAVGNVASHQGRHGQISARRK